MKWEGDVPSSFSETLGVRQGETWSPTGYKFFINPLLNSVKDHGIGFHIGLEFCGSVAVADDLLFLSTCQREQQLQASIQEEYAQKEHYSISDTKTKLMNLNENHDNLNHECILNAKALGTVEEYKHIGVTRYCNLKIANKCLVEERMLKICKTYSLCLNGCRLPWAQRTKPRSDKDNL